MPDFKYILFDLTQYSDEEIKGEVHSRILLLLLKHIFDPDLFDKLPDILSLLAEVAKQDTGLQTIEALLRYLFSTIEDKNIGKIKNIVAKALTDEKGESVMTTIAERLRNEGIEQGLQQGIWQGIEMDLDIRFGVQGLKFMEKIRNIQDIQKLKSIMKAVKVVQNIDELDKMIN